MPTTAAAHNDGFAWRVLLGPTHNWPVPEPAREQLPARERCELCREPIDDSHPFVTNLAGEQPMHLACIQSDTEILWNTGSPSRRTWGQWIQRIFQAFASSPVNAVASK